MMSDAEWAQLMTRVAAETADPTERRVALAERKAALDRIAKAGSSTVRPSSAPPHTMQDRLKERLNARLGDSDLLQQRKRLAESTTRWREVAGGSSMAAGRMTRVVAESRGLGAGADLRWLGA